MHVAYPTDRGRAACEAEATIIIARGLRPDSAKSSKLGWGAGRGGAGKKGLHSFQSMLVRWRAATSVMPSSRTAGAAVLSVARPSRQRPTRRAVTERARRRLRTARYEHSSLLHDAQQDSRRSPPSLLPACSQPRGCPQPARPASTALLGSAWQTTPPSHPVAACGLRPPRPAPVPLDRRV